MKLLTHNMLSSRCLKNVTVGFPLFIKACPARCKLNDNKLFSAKGGGREGCGFQSGVHRTANPKSCWDALCQAAENIGKSNTLGLPKSVGARYEEDEEFLRRAHRALLEIEVMDGALECPETGRKFPIVDGIPSMVLNEDEI